MCFLPKKLVCIHLGLWESILGIRDINTALQPLGIISLLSKSFTASINSFFNVSQCWSWTFAALTLPDNNLYFLLCDIACQHSISFKGMVGKSILSILISLVISSVNLFFFKKSLIPPLTTLGLEEYIRCSLLA